MTQPAPPATVGTQPQSADAVNQLVGTHLRAFVQSQTSVRQDQEFLGVTDLKVAPYYFDAEQEALIKTAIEDLNVALQAIDMTNISRIIGLA